MVNYVGIRAHLSLLKAPGFLSSRIFVTHRFRPASHSKLSARGKLQKLSASTPSNATLHELEVKVDHNSKY